MYDGTDGETDDESDKESILEETKTSSNEWICQVERLEKSVDSRGKEHFRAVRQSHHTISLEKQPEILQEAQASTNEETHYEKKGPIITHVYNPGIRHRRSGVLEPESYIDIRSPMIMKVLRQLANHTVQV